MKPYILLLLATPLILAMQCKTITVEPNPECPEPVIISENEFRDAPADELTIISAEIINDCLNIEFASSGCDGSTWEINLYDANVIKESYPVQRDLRLSLKNQEECDAVITRNVSYDISPLQLDYDRIFLNLINSGEQLLYEY